MLQIPENRLMSLERRTSRYLKLAGGVICFLILLNNVWTIAHWNESRGVYDDVCYLRQAHLFQKFGLGGLNTDIARDDDHYLASSLKQIGFAAWNDPAEAPCHSLMPATHKRVLQYPPGTGFLLALFPSGFQMIPLYVLANVIVFGFVLLALSYARSRDTVLLTAAFGGLAMYLMVNPTRASYSMAPTMVCCAVAGFLTARLFTSRLFSAGQAGRRILLSALVGFVIGLSVDFRLPNLFLASGYGLFFLGSFLSSRNIETVWQAVWFGVACLAGMAPTLLANAINAGSPFATTYAGVDLAPPTFSLHIIGQYVRDMQFVLLVLATASIASILYRRGETGLRRVALVGAGNLAINLAFFLSHPIFEPYYTVPVTMLSLWSLLFAALPQPAPAADGRVLGRAANA